MSYRQKTTNSNFPQGANPAAKNQSVITEAGVGPILQPAVLNDFITTDLSTQKAQESLNRMHIRQSKEAAYSDKEAEHTRNL